MTFNPTSIIYLCRVPIDNTYKHQLYFRNEGEQTAYFQGKPSRWFENYLSVRTTRPDGSLQSSVKVDANINTLYDYNYMRYQNENHGNKWFYAFITKLVYVNESTTEIVFEQDVWQTWFTKITLKPSFVEREHALSDNIGDNVVPEKFNFQDFEYWGNETTSKDLKLDQWGYLIACTTPPEDYKIGRRITGVYQGVAFYYFTNPNHVSDFIVNLPDAGVESIVSISLIPEFALTVGNVGITEEEKADRVGFVHSSDYPKEQVVSIPIDIHGGGFEDVKNNKLFTAPFTTLQLSSNDGVTVEYAIEELSTYKENGTIYSNFRLYGDISITPSIMIMPEAYKGSANNPNFALTLRNFPQCSYNSDYYKMWLTKNTWSSAANIVNGLGTTALGGVTMIGTSAIGAGIGASMILSGVTNLMHTIGDFTQASVEANKSGGGATSNNLLTAMGKYVPTFRIKKIKSEYAKIIDDFFTIYGYQLNKVKIPSLNNRKYYTYTKTNDCNIVGNVPCEAITAIKNMFNMGVTFWNENAYANNDKYVLDYSVTNTPIVDMVEV